MFVFCSNLLTTFQFCFARSLQFVSCIQRKPNHCTFTASHYALKAGHNLTRDVQELEESLHQKSKSKYQNSSSINQRINPIIADKQEKKVWLWLRLSAKREEICLLILCHDSHLAKVWVARLCIALGWKSWVLYTTFGFINFGISYSYSVEFLQTLMCTNVKLMETSTQETCPWT